MSPRRTRIPALATMCALSFVAVLVPSPAHAKTYTAHCAVASGAPNACTSDGVGTSAAYATYADGANRYCITDDRRDGHSVLIQLWPKGKPGQKSALWNKSGKGEESCLDRLFWGREDAAWRMRACIGEWNQTAAQSHLLDCGQTRAIRL